MTSDVLITAICLGVLALMFAVRRAPDAPVPVDALYRENSIKASSADEAAVFEQVWSEVQQRDEKHKWRVLSAVGYVS